MHPLRPIVLAIVCLATVAAPSRAQSAGRTQHRPPTMVVGMIERIERIEEQRKQLWELWVRQTPPGRTTGVTLLRLDPRRAVVRDSSGRTLSVPELRTGDSVTAWIPVLLLSDPAIAYPDSVRIKRPRG